MSSKWFNTIWGGGQAQKTTTKDAILGLRSNLDMLSKREKHLQNQMEEQDGIARKFVNSNKNAARAALRRKKLFEHSLEQTSAQIISVEREIYSIETASINKETLDAMKNASKAMKTIHGGLTIDKVDQTMEDLREQHVIGEEIGEAITQGVGTNAMDEEDLDLEFEQMQEEELTNKMLDTGAMPVNDQVNKAPAAPTGPTKTQEEDDEETELAKLQAEMAM